MSEILQWLSSIEIPPLLLYQSANNVLRSPEEEAEAQDRPSTPSQTIVPQSLTKDVDAESPSKSSELTNLFDAPEHPLKVNPDCESISSVATSVDPPTVEIGSSGPDLPCDEILQPKNRAMVWVLSCLQCALKRLPCNKSIPSCSRCVRNNEEDVCLVQITALRDHSQIPELFLDQFESRDRMERKKQLWEKLLNDYQSRMDRKNWAPSGFAMGEAVCSQRHNIGDHLAFVCENYFKHHPGRGMGYARTAVLNLHDDIKDINYSPNKGS